MKGNCLRGRIMCIMLTTVLGMVASLCQAQVIELAVGEGITLYTPDPEYPYLDWANALWDSTEAPDMGFSQTPDKYEAHVGINRYFTGTQKITCTFWWTKVSSHGGSVMSPMMTKTWYFKCKGDNSDPGSTPAQNITINSTNFPDANYRNHVIEYNGGSDGILTDSEMKNVKIQSLWYKQIHDLKGVEYFTELIVLDCSQNELTSLDLSKNTKLVNLNCSNNMLTSLDLSKNTNLLLLDCSYNRIRGSAMDNLINSLPYVSDDYCEFRVINCNIIEQNYCTKDQVARVKAKGWKPMCKKNSEWVEYEGADEPVDGLPIDATNFPDANFRNYLLEQDYGKDGVLTESEIKSIKEIDVNSKSISSLKGIEFFTSLEYLHCSANQLTALDVSKNTALRSLFCGGNLLTALDVSKNTALLSLDCWGNLLTALDVSKNTALFILHCDDNQLAALDVSKNTALNILGCDNNKIKGAEMDKLISSLPQNTTSDTYTFRVIDPTSENEGNVCTKSQVAAIKAKGWIPEYYNGTFLEEYEGSEEVKPTNIVLPSTAMVVTGQTISLTPEITPVDAATTLTWTSDDETIAKVNANGVVTGIKKGQTFINAETDNGKTAHCKLTVTEPEKKVTGITLDKTALTLEVGKSQTLNATVKPDDATNKSVTWSSSKTSVATVDNNGKVTALAAGSATITCTANNDSGVSATCTVTIKAAPESITLPSSSTVKIGQTLTLTPTLTPTDATTTLTWTSDDETIATVSSEGVVTGVKKGQTFINVETDNGKTAYCKLTVTVEEPTAISLPKNVTLMVDENFTLTPTQTPADAETVLTWKSDDESVVRVSAEGVLTGVAEGLAIVTVSTANGLTSGACKVKVVPDTTGICDVEADGHSTTPVYTLSGQRLAKPRKGLNIVGGKKVIVK